MLKQHIMAEKTSPMYASENIMNALLPNALQHVTISLGHLLHHATFRLIAGTKQLSNKLQATLTSQEWS